LANIQVEESNKAARNTPLVFIKASYLIRIKVAKNRK
jgi:hypothetical protein